MATQRVFRTHDEYVEAAPAAAQAVLREVLARVQAALPEAEPCIGYGMPAFRRGRVFFYVGAFARHLGVYPPLTGRPALEASLEPYRRGKGNLAFPYDRPIPYELVVEVARALAEAYGTPG